jgi:hypothetical protein
MEDPASRASLPAAADREFTTSQKRGDGAEWFIDYRARLP